MGDLVLPYLGLVISLGYFVQTVTGFGSVLICLTLGAFAVSIPEIIPLVVPLSLLQTTYIVTRHRRDVRWRLLLRRILPVMGAGLALGMFVFRGFAGDWLRYVFGAMVLALAARELWRLLRADQTGPHSISLPASIAAIFGAGVTHGIYAAGGPLLVYATGREGLDKAQFRATLTAVWLVLNSVLVAGFVVDGTYTAERLTHVGLLAVAVPVGVLAGEWAHHRVPERRFKITVFALLIAAAISLLLK